MKVLVVGGGGREHTIVWKLAQSSKVEKIYCAPGNAGIAELAECLPINVMEIEKLVEFAVSEKIDLTFVGPEDPLLAGIVDQFQAKGLTIFGPNARAALIEGSKSFAKELMEKYEIPTAHYATFTDYEQALQYVRKEGAPIVIKADGLAAGKGVTVAMTLEEAETALREAMQDEVFGAAGAKVVIEQFLQGEEMTLLSFVDGEVVKPMVLSQDHKPAFDGDKGPNTGGMGSYSPVPQMPQELIDQIVDEIVAPTAKAMVQEGRSFQGILYTGLIQTEEGPKVIEYNARFGDPETQVVLPRLDTDLIDIFVAGISGELDSLDIQWKEDAAVCVVMASGGYPDTYEAGKEITGLEQAADKEAIVFHAGTALQDNAVVTNGGRVLGVTSIGPTVQEAQQRVYQAVSEIKFEGAHYRSDIADKALRQMK
ncbi:phosphoribosylamine--glycine ligase [Ammoniphilus oxalaticus]|uniref:Phosphoribosylamine--glycine ligase n=1 Tax=Ammoniphilus oxalaticus TaxID=66863 RepID=A0A419SDB5_9BACL|nr:phosphoribosylamine--glycine ligase [Ammoniphilus oxalaticus]RKD21085.1 phosphoribosylamine--glycine ligase [Ammoniphilus oxalaticus]